MNAVGLYNRMDKVQGKIAKAEKIFGNFAMAFIIVINIFGIFSRYILNYSIIYIPELTILGAVWLFFIGMGLVFKAHSDIKVEFLVRFLPRKYQLIDTLLVDILILFFAVTLAWQTWKFIPFCRLDSNFLSFALQLPDEIYYYPIGLGAISIFLTYFHDFIGNLINFQSDWKEAT